MSEIIENMPKTWWTQEMDITIDRLGCMTLVGLVDLALRHPELPATTSSAGKQIGLSMLERMLEDGLELPESVKAAYRETFMEE